VGVLLTGLLAALCAAAVAVMLQPLYKRFLGYEVFGLGFLTSVVSSSSSSSSTACIIQQ
jgi:hypothetical protein